MDSRAGQTRCLASSVSDVQTLGPSEDWSFESSFEDIFMLEESQEVQNCDGPNLPSDPGGQIPEV